LACLGENAALGQVDPFQRELVQFGYNGAFEGHPPLAAYAFYYLNELSFLDNTNLTLRLSVAPTYLDSELGISHALGENTDVGIGVAGGGFADNYYEIRQGTYLPDESFPGYGGQLSLAIYHLFDPGRQIPLYFYFRVTGHYSTYAKDEDTAPNFQEPPNRETLFVRTGLRLAGREPVLYPDLGMEVSAWYEGQFRWGTGEYGFNDRSVLPQSHLFWGEALLAYTLPTLKHSFYFSVTAGTSISADRFSAYRLGALLPLVSEFPLSLPGYFYQELSAERFVLIGGNYVVPLDHQQRWNVTITGTTAAVDYLPGLEQPGTWNSGVGGGILYKSASWKIMTGYAYGIDAIRSHGRGANSIGILIQWDLQRGKPSGFNPAQPSVIRGLQQVFDWL
jgi:hypothetical protein